MTAFARTPRLFNIPPHIAFVDALARGLLARSAGDPMALAATTVLLPNRRAARALTEAFVRHSDASGRGGLLLPRMTPVGDMDDDAFARFAAGAAPLLPAVPPLRRRFELARLVRQLPAGPEGGSRSPVEALRLGDALCSTLDTLLEEEIAPERLRDVVDNGDLASHWQRTLDFLDLVITAWPEARRSSGGTDGRTRMAALIDATIARWQVAPPPGRIVAAGITNASPPVVRLLAAILALPGGMVVLPGLDTDLSEAGERRWQAIKCLTEAEDSNGESGEHPQCALKTLLARLKLERADAQDWGSTGGDLDGSAARTALLFAAMAPAAATEAGPDPVTAGALAGLKVVECVTAAEEAQVIALAMRGVLEDPGRRAALVTPDRALARRVAAHCRRWGIEVDDSAGTPLPLTLPGGLAMALAEALAQGFAPVPLLGLLKHPLVRADMERGPWLARVRRLDMALRGVRPPAGLDAVAEALDSYHAERRARAPGNARFAADAQATERWWDGVAALLAPLEDLRERRRLTLPDLAAALRVTAGALASDTVWAGAAGRMLATRIADIEAHGDAFGPFEPGDAPLLLGALIAGCDVRTPFGSHPRLAILGPVEAQLARADLMILAGLNETVWPGRLAPDPWLAPLVRARLGLPTVARGIGLAAQDFVRAAAAPQVLLTRARRDAAGPMVPSRFWLRLQAVAGQLPPDDMLLRRARAIDRGGRPPGVAPPAPNPPLALRPTAISVTDIDTLVADPFAFHCRRILKLRPLDPLDQDPTAAMRGNIIHAVLEAWVKAGADNEDQLMRIADERLAIEAAHFPLLRALWIPRARRAIAWAGARILERQAAGWTHMAAEAEGRLTLANGIVLNGRADRVDRHEDGRLAVIDYKTGTPPSAARVLAGEANQLGLVMALAAGGHLATSGHPMPAGTPGELAYWQLTGGRSEGKVKNPLVTRGRPVMAADAFTTAAVETAAALTDTYLLGEAPFPPKLRPAFAWTDYDHVAREAEWAARR